MRRREFIQNTLGGMAMLATAKMSGLAFAEGVSTPAPAQMPPAADDLTIIADNCRDVSAHNELSLPLLVVGLADTQIICDREKLSIAAV